MENLANALLIATIGLVLYASAFVTYHTLQSEYFEKRQKIIIVVLAWVLPIIGPVFILGVLLQDKVLTSKRGRAHLLDYIFLAWVFGNMANQKEPTSSEYSADIPSDTEIEGDT